MSQHQRSGRVVYRVRGLTEPKKKPESIGSRYFNWASLQKLLRIEPNYDRSNLAQNGDPSARCVMGKW